jgi:Gp49-like protein DUF891
MEQPQTLAVHGFSATIWQNSKESEPPSCWPVLTAVKLYINYQMSQGNAQSSDDPALLDDFVEKGDWGEVRHAQRLNGRMEAKEWLDNVATASEAAKFTPLFQKIANTGRIINTEHFRKLRDDIWEFKRDGNRILCFQHGRCWRLTHHYPKSKNKCPPAEIEKAIVIQSEFLSRAKNDKKR